MDPQPSLEEVQARHRRELKDLQGRITNKKKNASKRTRKGVNDECESMERELRERQAAEIAAVSAEKEDGPAQDADGEALSEPQTRDSTASGDGSGSPSHGIKKVEEKLERGLEKLHLVEPADPTTSPSPPNGTAAAATAAAASQQPAPKKRNRQKERMARRAAEQEAATVAAEQEAASMTDHRGLESASMNQTFAAHGLVEEPIAPDGHCLFSAVADQLQQARVPLPSAEDGQPPYKAVRRAATDYMAAHRGDFEPFLTLEEEDGRGFDAYLAKMRDTAAWGGNLELMAVARGFGVEVRVVQSDGRVEKIGAEEGTKDKGQGKVLWLAYYRHGYGLGEHYNSLRRK